MNLKSKKNQKIILISMLVTLVVIIAIGYRMKFRGPTWGQHISEVEALKNAMADVLPKIKKALGSGRCSADSDCRLIGLGVELCGNHERYGLYSIHDVNEHELKELVAIHNDAAEKLNRISYKVLGCGVKPNPVKCIRKACTPIIGQ
jgi:hypothetical protein